MAGLAFRAVPRWLAAVGVLIAIGQFAPSPWGFYASLAFLLWTAVAGIALAVRPPTAAEAPRNALPVG